MEAEATAKAEREAAVKIAQETARILAENQAKLHAETARIREEERAMAKANGGSGGGPAHKATVGAGGMAALAMVVPTLLRSPVVVVGHPNRMQIIESVARSFGVSILTADEWLRGEFGREAA